MTFLNYFQRFISSKSNNQIQFSTILSQYIKYYFKCIQIETKFKTEGCICSRSG